MTLTLEVIGEQGVKLGAAATKMFRDSGGTIGRLQDNAWSLPDPFVSGRHAAIRFSAGTFYIEDRDSRNGVFINSPENRLAPGQAHPLRSGDWILIEPYEIRVSIQESVPQAAADPFAPGPAAFAASGNELDALLRPAAPRRADAPGGGPLDPIPADGSLDPLELLFGKPSPSPSPAGPKAEDLGGLLPVFDPFQPPPVRPASPPPPSPSVLPDDWNRPPSGDYSARKADLPPRPRPVTLHPDLAEPPSRPSPGVPRPPAARGNSVDLAAVFAGAGLSPATVPPEFARDFGRILRIVVEGLMEILRARREFKNEFRLGVTSLRAAENNPLKFSANVDDALHNLLVKRNPAYLGTVEAFDDALDDVRNDQLAMLAGMRAAFDAMLQEFDPDRLQQAFDKQGSRGALLSTPAKLRYWDQYRDKFHDMVRDPEKCFRNLFGDEFAAAYEEHLAQLKARERR